MVLSNSKSYYNHKEYAECVDVANFAKIYSFKDSSGKELGRNKVYAVLKALGFVNKNNEPYQQYINNGLLKGVYKPYYQGDKLIPKTITLITRKGMQVVADRINEHLGAYGKGVC